jgi:dipeptidyl aminopeptidase/acylaminoacyl peptidase
MIRVLSVFFLAASAWTAAAQPLPVEEFFKRSEYSQMVLSPDGRHIAAVVRGAGRDALAVVDVDKRSALRITKFKDGDILDIHWTNNTRLLFSVGEDYEATGDRRFFGWYAVNADGSDFYEVRVPGFRYLVPDPERGDDIVIEGRMRQGAPDVYRYNTKSGRMTLLTWERPSNPFNWRTDHKGVPRLAASYYKGIATIWYRDAEGQPWRKMHEAELNKLDVDPIMFDFDDRTLFVASGGMTSLRSMYTTFKTIALANVWRAISTSICTKSRPTKRRARFWGFATTPRSAVPYGSTNMLRGCSSSSTRPYQTG